MTLIEKRRSMHMALGELARRCQIGTAEMAQIERGRKIPDDSVLSNIGEALGWTTAEVKAALPAKEDADASDDCFLDSLKAMAVCHEDAKAKGFGKGRGGIGEVECPICNGRLRYSVAAINGHMWGACSSNGCARWMQ